MNSLKSFSIIIGSPGNSRRLDEAERLSAVHKIGSRFGRFTVIAATSFSGGRSEDALVIKLATRNPLDVVEVADALRRTFSLERVEIEHGLHCRHLTAGTSLGQLALDLVTGTP